MKEIFENMSSWIFKAIYYPITFLIVLAMSGFLVKLISEVGWDVPIRWLLIINMLAIIAEYFVNK